MRRDPNRPYRIGTVQTMTSRQHIRGRTSTHVSINCGEYARYQRRGKILKERCGTPSGRSSGLNTGGIVFLFLFFVLLDLPPISVPIAIGTAREATNAASPPEEPPGVRVLSYLEESEEGGMCMALSQIASTCTASV